MVTLIPRADIRRMEGCSKPHLVRTDGRRAGGSLLLGDLWISVESLHRGRASVMSLMLGARNLYGPGRSARQRWEPP